MTEFIIIPTSTLHFEILFHIIICGENVSGGGTIRGWSWEVFTGMRCDYIQALMGPLLVETFAIAGLDWPLGPQLHSIAEDPQDDVITTINRVSRIGGGASGKWALGAQFLPLPHYLFLTHPPHPFGVKIGPLENLMGLWEGIGVCKITC